MLQYQKVGCVICEYRRPADLWDVCGMSDGAGLMIGCAVTSIVAGLFDVKHYFHLQVRLHSFAFAWPYRCLLPLILLRSCLGSHCSLYRIYRGIIKWVIFTIRVLTSLGPFVLVL
jgi:hypothetical protein